jgi:hypothetical protein
VNEQGGLTYKYREVPLRNYKNEQGKIGNLSDTYGSAFAATETTCERSGNIVTPACPPTTGTLTSLGSSPRTSPCKQTRAGIRIGETIHVETSSDIIWQRYNKEIGKYGKLF